MSNTKPKGGPITTISLETGEVISVDKKVKGTFNHERTTPLRELSLAIRSIERAYEMNNALKPVLELIVEELKPIRDGEKVAPIKLVGKDKVSKAVDTLTAEEQDELFAELIAKRNAVK